MKMWKAAILATLFLSLGVAAATVSVAAGFLWRLLVG